MLKKKKSFISLHFCLLVLRVLQALISQIGYAGLPQLSMLVYVVRMVNACPQF